MGKSHPLFTAGGFTCLTADCSTAYFSSSELSDEDDDELLLDSSVFFVTSSAGFSVVVVDDELLDCSFDSSFRSSDILNLSFLRLVKSKAARRSFLDQRAA